ncbi:MAG: T9SS type A sorting domain-containing protein [Candidatus Marinimicrobia bacterium]|nr:T9SS type A sorting domain-containing protein [Candidatus Neomarinimicrobiota bacterium]MBT4371593.1 T9SS type A sorting domain-containing protein [Candidatus Neomarinimicrobiota bacterium]MBT5176380.1 T9SS type A sorting domain-containing protein [Candidatus Neomarinimicrobiota bacterium]MBT6130371.1 T9SS type A sorting domain-containing protein [Candidatus Neomarinimicrobiota bacterium]MBT6636718.1 T9SS type A sorting domain-containing protein [Candidatus Neomarinimicrobiota bacterium]
MKHNTLKFTLLLLMSISWAQQSRATIQSGPIDYIDTLPERPLCALPTLTNEFTKAHLEKMKRYYPDVYNRMLAPPTLNKTTSVGTIQKFWVIVDDDQGGTKSEEVSAELLAKGDHTAIWADTSKISSSNNISSSLASQYITLLESNTPLGSRDTTKGIYDLELEYFGSPPNYDGDGIVDFLFTDIFSGAGGYFYGLDQTTGTGSNQRDIVYIDSYASVSYTEGTLSHELQHLIHYNYDTYETVQFNEGLSEMATIISGGDYISHAHYLNQADQMGWTWDGSAANYSMASLFVLYFVEQLGDASIKAFVQMNAGGNPKQSWQAFDQLMTNYGTGLTHKEWLVNWFTANYLHNKLIDPKFGYDQWMPMRARLTAKHLSGKVDAAGNTVKDYGANYIAYESSADSMEITFNTTSSGSPNFRSLEFNDSTVVVNTLSNGTKHLLYHDSLKVNSALFIIASTENRSINYDYASEGTDASGWTGFEEIAHDDGTADSFTTSDGSSFGFLGWGNNFEGSGWGVAFDPKMATNQLVELKVIMAFDQEFSGSGTPASADKDFYIHVWEMSDANGTVTDVVSPILWSTSRASLTGDWTRIDLTPYKEQLSNLGPIVIGIVEDDSVGTYFAMDKNLNGENYTYAFNYNSSGGLDPMNNFSIGGESLDGWNYMFRASFYIADSTVPEIKAGYMQHSIFSDVMKIYVVGNSVMSSDHMTVTANNAGFESVLEVNPVASNDSLLMIEQFKLNTSGTLDINVKGTMRYGRATIDTTFKYNVNFTSSQVGGDISSRDGNYIMSIPENSLDEDIYVIAGKDAIGPGTEKMRMANKFNLGSIYTVGPAGKKLNAGATISLLLNGLDPEFVSIGYWDGEVWREIRSFVSNDGTSIIGVGTHLGHYTLIPRGSGMPLAVELGSLIPTEYALKQNYPNPFNPETRIHYDLPESGHVSLVIYDILGRKLIQLVNSEQSPGRYNIFWKGVDGLGNPVSSGLYFYQLNAGNFSETKKMIISR